MKILYSACLNRILSTLSAIDPFQTDQIKNFSLRYLFNHPWKPATRGLDLFLSVSQVTRSKISQFLRQIARWLTLASLILIWGRNQSNHYFKGYLSFIVKHLVCRLQLIGTGYLFFALCVGFFFVCRDRLICRIFLHRRRFSGAVYLSTTF